MECSAKTEFCWWFNVQFLLDGFSFIMLNIYLPPKTLSESLCFGEINFYFVCVYFGLFPILIKKKHTRECIVKELMLFLRLSFLRISDSSRLWDVCLFVLTAGYIHGGMYVAIKQNQIIGDLKEEAPSWVYDLFFWPYFSL